MVRTTGNAQIKIKATGIVLLFLILVPILSHKSQSIISYDVYWRYQQMILIDSISETHHLFLQPLESESYLSNWAYEFWHNFYSPTLVYMLSQVSGLKPTFLQYQSFYTVILILVQAALFSRLVNKPVMFPVAILFAISYKFLPKHFLTQLHRGLLAWTFVLIILLYLTTTYTKGGWFKQIGLALLLIGLISSAHTLAVTAMIFFGAIFIITKGYNAIISEAKKEREIVSTLIFLLMSVASISYYTILYTWIPEKVLELSLRYDVLNSIGSLNEVISSITSTSIVSSILNPYIIDYSKPIYFELAIDYARIFAVVVAILAFCSPIYNLAIGNGLKQSGIVIFAVAMFGTFGGLMSVFFDSSGGISPLVIGLMFAPLFVVELISFIYDRKNISGKKFLYISLTIVILLSAVPAFAVTTSITHTSGADITSVSHAEFAQVDWLGINHGSGPVFSDFNTLSAYYTAKGDSPTYLPSPNLGYSTERSARKLIRYYYTAPGSVSSQSEYYIVSDKMMSVGIFHLNLKTFPHSDLDQDLSANQEWGRVYSSGSGGVYKNTN